MLFLRSFYGILFFLSSLSVAADGILPPPFPTEAITIPEFHRVLFVPGAGGQGRALNVGVVQWSKYFSSFEPIFKRLRIPYRTHAVSESGNESIEVRVEKLKIDILTHALRGEKILLIGHSMGGLVSRLVLRDSRMWPHVAGTIQLATPNFGTPLIDEVMGRSFLNSGVNIVSSFLGFDLRQRDYFYQLSQTHVLENYVTDLDFQDEMPPVFSVVAQSSDLALALEFPGFAVTSGILKAAVRNTPHTLRENLKVWGNLNDGLIPAAHQAWGKVLGIFPGGHAAIVGKLGSARTFENFALDLIETIRPGSVSLCEKKLLGWTK